MKRKVIQIAESTQLVSLPRKWAIEHSIKKGDELDIEIEGSSIVVNSGKPVDLGKIEVDVTGLDRDSIMFLIRALYKNGYDEIRVNFRAEDAPNIRFGKNQKVFEIIDREVMRLVGMELFSQKNDHCIIQSMSEDSAKAFDTIIRKVFLLTSEIISDLVEGFEKDDDDILRNIQSKHDTITRFISYSQRLLIKVGSKNCKKRDVLYNILEGLDELVDFIKFNSREVVELKIKPSKGSCTVYRNVMESFTMLYKMFYDFDLKNMSEINSKRHDTLDLINKMSKTMDKNEFMNLTHAEQVLEKIRSLSIAIIALKH